MENELTIPCKDCGIDIEICTCIYERDVEKVITPIDVSNAKIIIKRSENTPCTMNFNYADVVTEEAAEKLNEMYLDNYPLLKKWMKKGSVWNDEKPENNSCIMNFDYGESKPIVICDETNNSEQDRIDGNINVDISWPKG